MPDDRTIRRLRSVLMGLLAATLVILAYIAYTWWSLANQSSRTSMGPAPAFALIDQRGRAFAAEDLAGKVWIANFIFTNCPDYCPALTANMAGVQRRLRAEGLLGPHVMLVSFSVDPLRDTPDVLLRYAEQYGADHEGWRFLTGPPAYLDEVLTDGFFLPAERVPLTHDGHGGGHGHDHGAAHGDGTEPAPYNVIHSNRFVLVDRAGEIRAYHDGEQLELDRLMEDIRRLVREG